MSDALTGLPNTRYMFAHLTRELARAERLGTEVAILVLDLDDFKNVNDTHGHHVGDRALREVARLLRETVRPYDVCVRYAGDEFIIVLAGCGLEEAEAKRLELQQAIHDVIFEAAPGCPVRIGLSIGAAVFPGDGDTYEALLATADGRMYRDKKSRKSLGIRSRASRQRESLVLEDLPESRTLAPTVQTSTRVNLSDPATWRSRGGVRSGSRLEELVRPVPDRFLPWRAGWPPPRDCPSTHVAARHAISGRRFRCLLRAGRTPATSCYYRCRSAPAAGTARQDARPRHATPAARNFRPRPVGQRMGELGTAASYCWLFSGRGSVARIRRRWTRLPPELSEFRTLACEVLASLPGPR